MKVYARILVSTLSVLFLIAGVMAKAPRAAAQTGTVQFTARVTPSAGEDEPVRTLPFYLLSKELCGHTEGSRMPWRSWTNSTSSCSTTSRMYERIKSQDQRPVRTHRASIRTAQHRHYRKSGVFSLEHRLSGRRHDCGGGGPIGSIQRDDHRNEWRKLPGALRRPQSRKGGNPGLGLAFHQNPSRVIAAHRTPQGCSMHSTQGHREHGFDASDRGGEAVLRDCVGLIAAQDIVGPAAHSGEDPRIFSDTRGILA